MPKYKILAEVGGNEHAPDWRDDGIYVEAENEEKAIRKAYMAGVFGYELDVVLLEGDK